MKNLFLLPMLFLAFGINAQQAEYSTPTENIISYHENVSAANRMFKHDSLLQAFGKFDVAIQNYKGGINANDYFKAALCAIHIKEEFKALDYLEKAITNGYELDSAKKEDMSFYNQNTKKEYIDGINKWHNQAAQVRNTMYETEILNLFESIKKYNSSKYTSALDYCIECAQSGKKCNKTTPDYQSKYRLVREKRKADSIAAVALVSQIQKHGFPSIKTVGKKASDMARQILLNYDSDRSNKILSSILYLALIDGNISPEFYATVIDRRNLLNGGAPEFYQPSAGQEKIIATNIAVINKKRKSIGLYPLVVLKSTGTKPKTPAAPTNTNVYDY